MKSIRLDLTNKIFHNWRVIKYSHTKNKIAFWECVCKCGKIKIVNGSSLRRNLSKSCGSCGTKGTKNYLHPLYSTWYGMMNRCYNKNHMHYKNYGGRGILVCERWHDFSNFASDIVTKQKNKTLDRINNDGNYELSNCKWSNSLEQSNNTRWNRKVLYKDKYYTISELSRLLNIKYTTLKRRIDLGKTLDKKVNKKIENCNA